MGVVVKVLMRTGGRGVDQAHSADTDVDLDKDGVEIGELVGDDG